METRLLIAYALMLLMALAVAAIGFRLWHNSPRRAEPRERRRDQRRYEQRIAAREAAEGVAPPPGA